MGGDSLEVSLVVQMALAVSLCLLVCFTLAWCLVTMAEWLCFRLPLLIVRWLTPPVSSEGRRSSSSHHALGQERPTPPVSQGSKCNHPGCPFCGGVNPAGGSSVDGSIIG